MAYINFISLGCDKNLVDSECMLGLLMGRGHKITYDDALTDVFIINTCCFIESALQESIDTILEYGAIKAENPARRIVVAGCMAERFKSKIFEEIPEVDAVVGTTAIAKILDAVDQVLADGKNIEMFESADKPTDEGLGVNRVSAVPGGHFAYLKIAEGCDSHCTYCIIPKLRGAFRSRTMESLIREAETLAERGVKELILVAQDTALYGKDLYDTPSLDKLLQGLSKINDIEWIRILYAYPEHITKELIDEIARNPKICKYLDIPIQHSEDAVLRRMGRHNSKDGIIKTVNALRTAIPEICLRTTVICGFPGETQAEADALVDFIRDMKFDRLGAFAYSQEDGTPAALLPEQHSQHIKQKRLRAVMSAQKTVSRSVCERYIGRTLSVIIEGYLPDDGVYCGRSYRDAPDIDGLVFVKSPFFANTGDILSVNITSADFYDLTGDVTDEHSK